MPRGTRPTNQQGGGGAPPYRGPAARLPGRGGPGPGPRRPVVPTGQPGPGQLGRLLGPTLQAVSAGRQVVGGRTWPMPGERFGEDLFSIGPRSQAEGRAPAYRLQGPFYQGLREEAEMRRRLRAFGPGANVGRKSRRGIDSPAISIVPLDEPPSYAGEYAGGGGYEPYPMYDGGGYGGGGGGGGGGDFPPFAPEFNPWQYGLTNWRV